MRVRVSVGKSPLVVCRIGKPVSAPARVPQKRRIVAELVQAPDASAVHLLRITLAEMKRNLLPRTVPRGFKRGKKLLVPARRVLGCLIVFGSDAVRLLHRKQCRSRMPKVPDFMFRKASDTHAVVRAVREKKHQSSRLYLRLSRHIDNRTYGKCDVIPRIGLMVKRHPVPGFMVIDDTVHAVDGSGADCHI